MSAPSLHVCLSSLTFIGKIGGLGLLVCLQSCQPPRVSFWMPDEDYTIWHPTNWEIRFEGNKLLVYPAGYEGAVVTVSVFPQTKVIDSVRAQAIIRSLYDLDRPQIEVKETSVGEAVYFEYAHQDSLRQVHCYTQLRQYNDQLALITAHSPYSVPKRIQKRLLRMAQSFRFATGDPNLKEESL